MRLWILSDLHADVGAGYQPPEHAPEADVIVIAGDARTRLDKQGLRYVARTFGDFGLPIVFVPGNHDFWRRSLDTMPSKARPVAEDLGIHLLAEGEAVTLGDTRFIGATLWTDYAVAGDMHGSMRDAYASMNDVRRIRANGGWWQARPQQYRDAHIAQRARIESLLEEPHFGPTVVVTHHAPHPASLRDGRPTELLDAAYASDLSAIMEGPDAPDLWIHGHIHQPRDYVIGATRVVANPHGYVQRIKLRRQPERIEREVENFDPLMVVEVVREHGYRLGR